MAGISLLVDLCRKNPSFNKALQSHDLLSATFAVSAAATASASLASGSTLASRFLFGDGGISVAYSDAGAELTGDYLSKLRSFSEDIFKNDYLQYSTKVYPVELKPLFSAFQPRTFALTSLRALLLFYLPLLEPSSIRDDDDFPEEVSEDEPLQQPDLVTPLKKSAKQIILETTVTTTRRILERVAVHHVSQRMAWKLIKDIPRSARRKARRGMSSFDYCYCVSRTTFRGHFLSVAASWLVQVGIEIYRCFSSLTNSEEADRVNKAESVKLLGTKVLVTSIKCSASLICAGIGAGIGATLIHPSYGLIIGCAAGDLAGPILVIFLFDRVFHVDLRHFD